MNSKRQDVTVPYRQGDKNICCVKYKRVLCAFWRTVNCKKYKEKAGVIKKVVEI